MAKVQYRSGCFYHVYNRGVNRGRIFFRQENYAFFLRRMRKYVVPEQAQIVAYCLMPTHYHLFVQVHADDVFGDAVMQPFMTSYVKAVNKEQDRVGPLFQGKYKAILVDDDAYFSHLSRYIHLNPVEAGYVDKAEDWPFSSYRDYLGLRQGTIPQSDVVLRRFGAVAAYRRFVEGTDYAPPRKFKRWLDETVE